MHSCSMEIGSLTFKISSESCQTSSRVAAILAPAAVNSSSVIEEPMPAPAWTSTSWPCLVSSCTPDGVMATRYSWFLTSVGTPTLIGPPDRTWALTLIMPRSDLRFGGLAGWAQLAGTVRLGRNGTLHGNQSDECAATWPRLGQGVRRTVGGRR